jgi:hypothetical protein
VDAGVAGPDATGVVEAGCDGPDAAAVVEVGSAGVVEVDLVLCQGNGTN